MRTLVYDVIAYFARTNIVHAHTRTRVKLIQSHTRSFAETQMHGRRRTQTNYVDHAYTHTQTDADDDSRAQTDGRAQTQTDAQTHRRTDAQTRATVPPPACSYYYQPQRNVNLDNSLGVCFFFFFYSCKSQSCKSQWIRWKRLWSAMISLAVWNSRCKSAIK